MSPENTPEQRRTRKVPSLAWRKGQSGNPGGRPKVAAEVKEIQKVQPQTT